jgi:hypothetical protein
MASETPHDKPLGPVPSGRQRLQSVWQKEWQWVALAWSGGIFIGGIFLMLALASDRDAQTIVAMVTGAIFLAIVPGLCATLQTWQGHRRSVGKGSIWPWAKGR